MQAVEVVIWYPAKVSPPPIIADEILAAPLDAEPDRSGAPYPVVLFSHGSGGFGSTAFTTHLASHGFVVIEPSHVGMRTDRPAELITALDQVSSPTARDDALLPGLADSTRAGASGYSLGGDSALRAVAQDHRFRAVIAMAPGGSGTGPPPLIDAASGVVAPVMLMWGMLDNLVPYGNHQTLLDRLGEGATERWLVTLRRGHHSAFADRCSSGRRGCGVYNLPQDRAYALISYSATAFLLRHVAGDERYQELLRRMPADDPEIQVELTPARCAAQRTS